MCCPNNIKMTKTIEKLYVKMRQYVSSICVVSSGIDSIKNLVGDSMGNIENLVDYYVNLIKSCGDTGRSDGIQNQHWLQKLL